MNYSFTSQNILSRFTYCKWIVKQYLSQHCGKLITGVAGIILTLLTRQVVRWGITHQDTVALGGNPNIHQIQNIIYTRQVVRWGITHQDTVALGGNPNIHQIQNIIYTRQVVRWGITHQDTVVGGTVGNYTPGYSGNPNIHQIQNITYTRQVVQWGITHQDTVAILTYIKYKISYTHGRWYGGELHTRIQWHWVAILIYVKYKTSYIHQVSFSLYCIAICYK